MGHRDHSPAVPARTSSQPPTRSSSASSDSPPWGAAAGSSIQAADGGRVLGVQLGQGAPAPGAEVALVELGGGRRGEPERLRGLPRAGGRAAPDGVEATQARGERTGLFEPAMIERLVEREGRTARRLRRGVAHKRQACRGSSQFADSAGSAPLDGADPFDRLAAISATVRGSR